MGLSYLDRSILKDATRLTAIKYFIIPLADFLSWGININCIDESTAKRVINPSKNDKSLIQLTYVQAK